MKYREPIVMSKNICILILLILFIFFHFTPNAYCQEKTINYNTYYRYPLSIGVEYQNLTPFSEYGSNFNIYEIAAWLRWPILKNPVFIPVVKSGIMTFDSQDQADPEKWDHQHYFTSLGILYSNRFTKNFEVGAEVTAGFSRAAFKKLIPEEGTLGTSNLLFELGGRICLNPSFNFSIDINPNLRYLQGLGTLKDFNGLIFGLGFSGHYRFGQDPDSQTSVIRSIRFEGISIPPVFAAMQSYYTRNPIGKIKITNIERFPITDIEVSFFQSGYMDSPTVSASIPSLGPGESKDIGIIASFNEEIFRTEGVTPLTGEIVVKYSSKGRPAEQRQSVSYDLHDKTAITWDDNRKVGAFITPADSALRNYTSFIRQTCKGEVAQGYPEAAQIAIQVYEALGEIGCIYQVDPVSPFTSVQGNPVAIDSISLPRDTLKRITGDCDDLTVLYCSLLETAGVETGFITTPGHIYSCFNTKVQSQSYKSLHPERGMMINLNGELWVPVEITLIGKADFLEAWRKGAEEWTRYESDPDKRGFFITRKAQELYRPVGLKETDLGLQYGSRDRIVQSFRRDMGRIANLLTSEYRQKATKDGRKEDWNQLGIIYGKFGQYTYAEEAFRKALLIDSEYVNAQVNLGSLMYLKGDYNAALVQFRDALSRLEKRGKDKSQDTVKVLLNLSKTYNALKLYDESKKYYELASAINPEKTEAYSYLGKAKTAETRASEGFASEKDILFMDDVEGDIR